MRSAILFAFILLSQLAFGQKYFSKTGKVSFTSEAPLETIEAVNTTANTVLDKSTGTLEWSLLVKGFSFEKALMQDHFNENYMESHTYPKAKFKGKIENATAVNLEKDGEYAITVPGELEIHGVTRPMTAKGTISVQGGKVSAKSQITIALAEFGIQIPRVVEDKIAREVHIRIEADYKAMDANP